MGWPPGSEFDRAKVKKGSTAQRHAMSDSSIASGPERRRGGLEPAKKQNLSNLVSYEPGSVVSRTIIQHKTGTVTLFAFDEGEELSEHTAAYDALLEVIEGEVAVTISGVPNEMKEGEAIILPAGKPHAVRATTKFKMLLTMIRE